MPLMPCLVRLSRALLKRVFRLVALLACVGQLAVVEAPLVEASAGASRRPHVEAQTNPLHHAHNPDLCPGCAALALVARPEAVRAPIEHVARPHLVPSTARVAGPAERASTATRPRAPPVWKLELRSFARTLDSHTPHIDAFCTLAVRALAERDGRRERAAA